MAFTTEALQELGLTEEQVKDVFALHGKDLNELKSDLENATQERDSLKNQLQNTEVQLETMKADATMNRRSIGLEHVNNAGAPNWTISEAIYATSAKLIADIAKRYNIPIDAQHIIPHKEVSATACPAGIDVGRLIRMAQDVAKGGTAKSEPAKSGEYRVKTSEVMNIRSTPSLKGAVKSTAKAGVYTIVETKTADGYDWGKLKSGAGWIALKWAKRL